jgi:CheY-like chemotaxis protein
VRRLGHEPEVFGGPGVPQQAGIDVAVIDPSESDGLELARRLRAARVPVLFTSIYPATEDLLALSPSAYLVKPFPLDALERALEEALTPTAASRPRKALSEQGFSKRLRD